MLLLLVLGTVLVGVIQSESDIEEFEFPETGIPAFDECGADFSDVMNDAMKSVQTFVPTDEGLATLTKRFCDGLQNFTSCIQSSGLADIMGDTMANLLPPELVSQCQDGASLPFIPGSFGPIQTGTPTYLEIRTKEETEPTTRRETTEPTTRRETTEPTTRRETTEPTTRRETTEPTTRRETTEPTTRRETTEPTTRRETTEATTTTERITTEPTERTGKTVECAFGHRSSDPTDMSTEPISEEPTSRPSNRTTTEPMVDPTENPTEPREDCFKENLRTHGEVLKQVAFTSDEACEELCLTIKGCKAVVTSPMYWAVTECFIIGEFTLSTSNAYGWDTAERSCFDRDFEDDEEEERTRPMERTTPPSNITTTEPMVDPTENPTEPREDCFKENLRTHGEVLKQVRYTSDDACEKLCLTIEGCRAVVTSPMYWYWTECFIIGEYTLSRSNAYGWDTAERSCFDRHFEDDDDEEENNGRCPASHPNVYYNGEYCCKSTREKYYWPQGDKCDGSLIQRNSLCCEGDMYIRCPSESGICDSEDRELEDEEPVTPEEDDEPALFDTDCTLKVTSAGGPASREKTWYGRRESFNGDVSFLADDREMLLIGLHPERRNLAVRNSMFRRGSLMWGYRWVSATYPAADDEGRREYTFQFTESAFVLKIGDRVLITIPYRELTRDREEFLRSINSVKFKVRDDYGSIDLQYERRCQEEEKETETKNWRDFSLTNRLDLAVNMDDEETFQVRFPCRDSIWFKLFLNGDGEQNSHVELFDRSRGNIYCNKAGWRSWYGGERTDFRIYKRWECEDDGENMILEVEKTSQYVKLKNKGNTLYTKVFSSRDGNCYKRTERLSTQVWNYDGSLSLYFSSDEEELTVEPEVPDESTYTTEPVIVTDEPERTTSDRYETREPTRTTQCDDNEFTCSERCIPETWRCDGDRDCVGGEDERGCETAETEKLKNGCEGNTCTVVAARGSVVFERDDRLTANNKEMYLTLEKSGNLVLYCTDGRKIWESETEGATIGKGNGLVIGDDGILRLNDDKTREVAWRSQSTRPSSFYQLVAQDDNNLVFYDQNERPVWSTATVNQCKKIPKEGGCSKDRCIVLEGGDDVILAPDERIVSPNGEVTLIMQTDGNLVLYCRGGVPIWHSDTWYWETENHRLVMRNTGEMVVVNTDGVEKWSSETAGNLQGVTLVAQDDNNLVLYTQDGVPIWHTNTAQNCESLYD